MNACVHGAWTQFNLPTQRGIDAGLTIVRPGSRADGGGELRITRTARITGKGQI